MRRIFTFFLILISFLLVPFNTYAKEKPSPSGIASTLALEDNINISVKAHTLDISINETMADINSKYILKNNSSTEITTNAMILSENIDASTVIIANNKNVIASRKRYSFYPANKDIRKEGYRFIVKSSEAKGDSAISVDSLDFNLTLKPNEESIVVVSGKYKLGGYPDDKYNSRYANINYYLVPPISYNGFLELEINLYLNSLNPIIAQSSIDFTHIRDNYYKYNGPMPAKDLTITLEPTFLQRLMGFFNNPNNKLSIIFIIIAVLILLGLIMAGIILLIVRFVRRKKNIDENLIDSNE